jgi:hypothetical protein
MPNPTSNKWPKVLPALSEKQQRISANQFPGDSIIATAEGWLYLAVILDLFSRR